MSEITLSAYAIFVEDEYAATFFVPADRDNWSLMMTAALSSNPTVVLDTETDIPNTFRYSIYVEGEYVDKLYQKTEPAFFYPINSALQSNPRIVLIETGESVKPGVSWTYVNKTFVRNE
jgi:hypothetical protein